MITIGGELSLQRLWTQQSLCLFFGLATWGCLPTLSWAENNHDLQWQRNSGDAILSLKRIKGDALAVRQRLHQLGEDQANIQTEISHLTSGCALTLTWKILPQKETGIKRFEHSVKAPQKGVRQLAKKISKERWPSAKEATRSLDFKISLPSEVALAEIKWYGCGWSSIRERSPKKTQSKFKPTLPNGAKSTPAQGMGAFLRSSRLKEAALQAHPHQKQLMLTSDQWNFAVVIEGKYAVKKTDDGWRWSSSKLENPQPIHLKLSIVHTSKQLTPIKVFKKSMKIKDQGLQDWRRFVEFLSYKEGVVDGLGRHGTTRSWASLLILAVMDDSDMSQLSAEWCESVLLGALSSLLAWPHIFRAYKRPVHPLDGRLLLPIALARYFFTHPEGKSRGIKFLKTKVKGLMLSSLVKRHLQDLIGRAAFFANRPSQKHLLSVSEENVDKLTEGTLVYSYTESVAIMPRTLKAIEKLLSHEHIKSHLGAPIGLVLRAQKTQKVWAEKSRSFFGRQIEVYDIRARIENWGRFLERQNPETPALQIKADIKYLNARLNETPSTLDAYMALDMLWGQHDQLNLKKILNHVRPFPAGLVTDYGVITENHLPFVDELSPQPSSLYTPNLGAGALWVAALSRQIKRKWPYKLIVKLEDARLAIWAGMKASLSGTGKFDPWQSSRLSVFDGLVLFAKEPPPIKAQQSIDPRELR